MDKPQRKSLGAIIIGKDGSVRAVYSDSMRQMLEKHGSLNMVRASRVDPGSELDKRAQDWLVTNQGGVQQDKWYADMIVGQHMVLGPYLTRQEALDAEIEALYAQNIPVNSNKVQEER